MSIKSHITFADPLSNDVIEDLINHKEEDKYLDYKQTIEQNKKWLNEKQWLGLTKDFMAFANTKGGYLVFGVDDSDFSIVGLSNSVTNVLTEPKVILEKINRYVRPNFTNIRTTDYQTSDGTIVAVHIPNSRGSTHIVTKEGSFIYPSGKKEIVLRPGDIYVRRSATNHIISPEGLDEIINQRIDYYKEKLFDRISRISEVSPGRLIEAEEESDDADSYKLTSDPGATPVKGMSFSTEPDSLEEEVAANIALSQKDPGHEPSEERLWAIYSSRQSLTLTDKAGEWLFKTYLLRDLPFFYWSKDLSPERIQDIIRDAINHASSIEARSNIIKVSMCFGQRFYRGTVGQLTNRQREQLDYQKDNFDTHELDSLFSQYLIDGLRRDFRSSSYYEFDEFLIDKLDHFTKSLSENNDREMKEKSCSIDFYLYNSYI